MTLANSPTTSLSGEQGGPFSIDKLFKLLEEVSNEHNIEYVICIFEKEIDLKDKWDNSKQQIKTARYDYESSVARSSTLAATKSVCNS